MSAPPGPEIEERRGIGRLALDEDRIAAVRQLHGARRPRAVFGIHVVVPQIERLEHMTVGIVSFGNAAVDNIRDKLDRLGFGHVIGNLGRQEKREEFFAGQAARNAQVALYQVIREAINQAVRRRPGS